MKLCGKTKRAKHEGHATLTLTCVLPRGHKYAPCLFVWHVTSGRMTVDTEEL